MSRFTVYSPSAGVVLSAVVLIAATLFSRVPSDTQYGTTALTALKCVSALALGWFANAQCSRWAQNRWLTQADPVPWDWANEIAVVTGGSNGLGAGLVKKLVAHGVKVAVLDIEPLSNELHDGMFRQHGSTP